MVLTGNTEKMARLLISLRYPYNNGDSRFNIYCLADLITSSLNSNTRKYFMMLLHVFFSKEDYGHITKKVIRRKRFLRDLFQ